MKYSLAIFDMDGTILDTITDLTNSINYTLRAFAMPERTEDDVKHFIGNGARRLCALSVPDGTDEETLEKFLKAYNEHYAVHCRENTRPYAGIVNVLQTIRGAGMKTAVVSNKPDFGVQPLCRLHFDGLFDFAAGQKDGIRRKPYPDSVHAACQALQIPVEKTVYIGDSEVDIETSRNAGTDCVLVDWGFRSRETLLASGAKTIVSTAEELLREILK